MSPAHTIDRRRLAVVVAVFFTAIGLANAAQLVVGGAVAGSPVAWNRALVGALPFWWIKAALVPVVYLAARRFPPLSSRWMWHAPAHLVFSLLFAAAPLVIGGTLTTLVYPDLGSPRSMVANLFASYFVAGASIYWLLLAAVHALEYYERYRERELHAAELARRGAELEARLTTARLSALRMQLNPHFLFNTLNSVSVLAMRGEGARVARMLDELAGMLRITLERDHGVVTLEEELELVNRYLAIEQVRFEDRLQVRTLVTPAARAARIPSLLLQPLVENAVKHGVGGMPGKVEVEIGARVRDGRTEIWVRDSGPGFDADAARSAGVGLANTRMRIETLFGDEAELSLSPPGRGAEVRVSLPYSPFAAPVSSAPSAPSAADERMDDEAVGA